MAAFRCHHDDMNYVNESEESDEENVPKEPSLDDLSFMLSLARYKRMQDIFSSAPLRRCSSRYVQTEPDLSNISPSWLFKAEKLADELYTGINNIINVLGHSSKNVAKKESKPSLDSAHLRHFTYKNGYWHSKLLNVKIKDSSEIDLKYDTCLTEDIEKDLAHLSEVSLKLKNTLPFIMEEFESDSLTKRLSRGQMKRSLSLHSLDCPYDAPNSDECVCTKFSDTRSDSGQSSACSYESCGDKIPASKRVKSDIGNFLLETLDEISEDEWRSVVTGSKRRYWLPPLGVSGQRPKQAEICELSLGKRNSKYPDKFEYKVDKKKTNSLVKQTTTLQPKTIASCSHHTEVDGNSNKIQRGHLRAREKQNSALFNQENYPKNRVTAGGRPKNFIRKNILALRNRSNFGPNTMSNCH